ncbi:MAG TPA: SRPBCC family protein [Bryobacteraceae bacterium]|jgi:choline monooxygenase|nr:SRPBCC family protein [Bryobacteraceae bacterium]
MDLSDYTFNPKLSQASTIPARWYTDAAFLEAERRGVFGRTWQYVGQAGSLATPGSYLACEVLGEPILVARAKDDCLRAFSNVCRHRGAILAEGSGQAPVIRCPYHAWTYSLDGRLLGQPEFEGVENWDRSQICLPQFQVETWGPFVFVNQDAQAPPLFEVLGAIPSEIAQFGCPFGELRFSYRRDYVVNCNWKVYIDNYLEGYHLPAAHPSLMRELDYQQYRVETFRYYSSHMAPIKSASGSETRRYEFNDSSRNALYYWIFPNFMLNIYPDNLSSNLILPLDADRTLTIFEWFAYSGDVAQATIDFSDEIQQEDIKVCESAQRGLRSRNYNQGRFSVKRENGVHHFHGLLNEYLAGQALACQSNSHPRST